MLIYLYGYILILIILIIINIVLNIITPCNKNSIVVMGMRRSGLHPICSDIINQYTNSNNYNIKLRFIGNVNYVRYKISQKNDRVILFEDKFYKPTKFDVDGNKIIIIIRDIYDNIISRVKVNKHWSKIDNHFISTYIDIMNEILGYTNFYNKKVIINYDLYIDNTTDYRGNILKNQFNFTEIDKMYSEISHNGPGKSFDNNNNRSNTVINNKIFNLISSNETLLRLVKEYFGYNLLDKLKPHLN